MIKSQDFDVAIVGAGPAGLSVAQEIAKSGCNVAVFEKSKEIGFPIHTSGGSWVDELEKLSVPKKFIHPIKIGEFIAPKSKSVFRYKKAASCVLDVRGYYQYLAEQASINGANIFVNAKVIDAIISGNFVKGIFVNINGVNYKINSKIVIDASGFNALIAKKVGLLKSFKMYGNGAEYDLISSSWNQEKVCFLINKVTPAGYGWVLPHGNNRVRIGVGIIYPISKESPVRCLDKFLNENNDIVKQLRPFSKIEFHRGVVPNDGYIPKTIYNGLIVVGDAAGQVSGIAGEGIRYAVDIGRIAGNIAKDSIQQDNYSEKYLIKYEKIWRKKYELSFKITHEINKRLRSYTPNDWNERIEKLSRLSPEVLVEFLKGNFSSLLFIKAFKQQPKLINSIMFNSIKRVFKIN
jgi:digeranylgeranylglycerophospholipid reductase